MNHLKKPNPILPRKHRKEKDFLSYEFTQFGSEVTTNQHRWLHTLPTPAKGQNWSGTIHHGRQVSRKILGARTKVQRENYKNT